MMKKIDGIKMTPQRMAILDFLEGNTNHPSVSDIYSAVSNRFPTISVATVYSTVEMLKSKGYINELNIDRERMRVDPNVRPHNHIICIYCKKIIDIEEEIHIQLSDKQLYGFNIIEKRIEFYGICPDCKKKRQGTL
ncbi:MAG: transcriptional repressor [Syntrophorhabdaceae bacterium]|nr:transcriptional repressor [Syntrophorhabdaceae bacterium]